MITLVSAFRNAAQRLDPYFAQVAALRAISPPMTVRVLAVVGDSQDDTEGRIKAWSDADLHGQTWWFRHDHGKPEHGSTEVTERLEALSGLLNASLDELHRYITPTDTVIWVEGDLYWDACTMIQLDRFLRRPEVDVIAPMVFAGEAFYDTWGFRTVDGRRWGPFFPWGDHDQIAAVHPLIPMGSVGSCVAMTGAVAQRVRVQNGNALVGWCQCAREHAYQIWCAKDLRVQHPFDWRRA